MTSVTTDRGHLGCLWLRIARHFQSHLPKRILVMGDSHIRVFEHSWFLFTLPGIRFDIEYVPGATAIGIVNRHSTTSALSSFMGTLATSDHDWVLLNLGEVDTAYSLWLLAEFRGCSIEELLDIAIDNYCSFITDVSAAHRVAILSAPLPTLADQAAPQDETAAVRQQIPATQRQRTDLTLAFNARMKSFCLTHGVPYLDSSGEAQGPDGLVKRSWCRRRGFDHHYARWPYARCLVRQLKLLFRDPPLQAVTDVKPIPQLTPGDGEQA
jgi:hypothetical protein